MLQQLVIKKINLFYSHSDKTKTQLLAQPGLMEIINE